MKSLWATAITLLLLAFVLKETVCQTADDDEVSAAYPGYPHTFYSGYLMTKIPPKQKKTHYVFFPSLGDKTADPLVVWLTGGPGCSSLLACFHENGPFTFLPGQKSLAVNPKTWNNKANLLYLQLPSGVGFSVGPEDEVITNQIFTKDALTSLRVFLARFPSYRKNDLYLTGHGYAAVYIANMAKAIIEQNNDPYVIFNDDFKLKGILIGNPCLAPEECMASGAEKSSYFHYEFLYNRGYFTDKTWNQFRGICTLNYDTAECYAKRVEMDSQFNKTKTSMYNIYDKCYQTPNNSFESIVGDNSEGSSDEAEEVNYINTGCEDNVGILTFLNDKNVKKNWNVDVDKEWLPCNNNIFAEYVTKVDTYSILPFLIKYKLRIWIYSGDLDSFVPIIGTKKWIENLRHSLEMPVKRIWREWWVPGKHSGEDQVGGFIWELRDFTFVTVKGAGFRAAYDQPQAMSEVLAGFLAGKTLPYKNG